MLLIIFFGLIVKLTSVCDGCDVGISVMKNFDWNQVGIVVLTRFLKQSAITSKTAAYFYIIFLLPLTNNQYNISELVFSNN